MAKAENIAAAIFGIGVVLVGAGILLGERATDSALILWQLGVPVAVVGFAMLLAVGAASLGRRGLGAVGVLPTPVEPAVPQPGWPGWRFLVEGTELEVWVDITGMTPRIVCDGRWAETTRSGRTFEFTVGRWPAMMTERVDWGTTALALPLVVGLGLLGGHSGAEPLPMRYDLAIDGTPVPIESRRVFGRATAPATPTPTPEQETGPDVAHEHPYPGSARTDAVRRLRADPPSR
jgi:hypothetical protein